MMEAEFINLKTDLRATQRKLNLLCSWIQLKFGDDPTLPGSLYNRDQSIDDEVCLKYEHSNDFVSPEIQLVNWESIIAPSDEVLQNISESHSLDCQVCGKSFFSPRLFKLHKTEHCFVKVQRLSSTSRSEDPLMARITREHEKDCVPLESDSSYPGSDPEDDEFIPQNTTDSVSDKEDKGHVDETTTGSKGDMEVGIKNNVTKKPADKRKNDVQPSGSSVKKTRIGQINEDVEINTQKEMDELKLQLIEKSKKVDALTLENEGLKSRVSELQAKLESSNEYVDFGSGFKLSREYLTTIKSTSPTLNVYARGLFKKLFEPHEVIGYSLMGKQCNALQHELKPSIDPNRRDSIIAYSLKAFGVQPSSPNYSHSLKDVKKSLACLISEIVKDVNNGTKQVIAIQGESNN